MQKNLTLKLDEHLIIKAKQKALGSGKSLSKLVTNFLRKFCSQETDIEKSRKIALKYMEEGFHLGKPLSREEMYDRG